MYSPYTTRHNLVLGFHGCDRRTRDAVIAGTEPLRPSENEYDWLGHGIYFWENNHHRALEFAIEQSKRSSVSHPIEEPAILGAVFHLGYCLDLLDTESLELVRSSHDYLLKLLHRSGEPIPENKGGSNRLFRNLDCAVILALHKCEKKTANPRSIPFARLSSKANRFTRMQDFIVRITSKSISETPIASRDIFFQGSMVLRLSRLFQEYCE